MPENREQGQVLSQRQHGIRRNQISPGSRRVCEMLQQHGFQAYVVGGAVRDLLLGVPPKDFDVATNATPEEVRATFRRSRIIGRRFRIVHVMMGHETIEVTTFRCNQAGAARTDEFGRVLNDNAFGSQAEDAERRDFTVNALYFDPNSEKLIDYHHGVDDLRGKTLRMIGEPSTRYREDPVRMLRAVRLGAKLGMTLEAETAAPIRELAPLLEHVPAARLFDEILKLLTCGHALVCLRQLREQGLHHGLLPLLDVIIEQPAGKKFIRLALGNTDRRVLQGKGISTGFLFATLLWHEVLKLWRERREHMPAMPALDWAMREVLEVQGEKLAIPRRIVGDVRDIWILQPRFEIRVGKRPYGLLSQARFRAAFDFFLLRVEAGELDAELAQWWSDFQNADGHTRAEMLAAASAQTTRGNNAAGGQKKRRRRRRSPLRTDGAAGENNGATANDAERVNCPADVVNE